MSVWEVTQTRLEPTTKSPTASPSARWSSFGDDEATTPGGSPMSVASDAGDVSPSAGSAGNAWERLGGALRYLAHFAFRHTGHANDLDAGHFLLSTNLFVGVTGLAPGTLG